MVDLSDLLSLITVTNTPFRVTQVIGWKRQLGATEKNRLKIQVLFISRPKICNSIIKSPHSKPPPPPLTLLAVLPFIFIYFPIGHKGILFFFLIILINIIAGCGYISFQYNPLKNLLHFWKYVTFLGMPLP